MKDYTIFLASKSPRRRDILTNAGYVFKVVEAKDVENIPDGIPPDEAVTEIALKKAQSVRSSLPPDKIVSPDKTIIIAADTMVFHNGILLGKPRDADDAFRMLKSLSGVWHNVFTGYAVLCGQSSVTGCEVTSVKFRTLKDKEIEKYIESKEPFDKAGSYGIQGRASAFIERVEGDFFNVIGLPICKISVIVDMFIS